MPQAGIPTEPSGADLFRRALRRREPGFVGVAGLFEIEIEEVVRGRLRGARPTLDVAVEPARDVGAVFHEVDERRMRGVECKRVDAGRCGARFGGDADAEPRQILQRWQAAAHFWRTL